MRAECKAQTRERNEFAPSGGAKFGVAERVGFRYTSMRPSQPMNLPEPSEGEIPLMPPADTPAKTFAITTGMVRLSEKAGDRIGRYKLLQQIGEGGCGVVYMAEQEEPVRRRAAVKVIKLGMDTKQVIARFEAERQALALMDHPNIAKVFDAGSTERPLTPGSAGILPASSALLTHEQPAGEDAGAPRQAYGQGPGERDVAKLQIENQKSQITPGRPYFVMELVRGIRITDYCDQNKLSTDERLSRPIVDVSPHQAVRRHRA